MIKFYLLNVPPFPTLAIKKDDHEHITLFLDESNRMTTLNNELSESLIHYLQTGEDLTAYKDNSVNDISITEDKYE